MNSWKKKISEFCGLMSKMYLLVDVNGMKSEKAKRINNPNLNRVNKTDEINKIK